MDIHLLVSCIIIGGGSNLGFNEKFFARNFIHFFEYLYYMKNLRETIKKELRLLNESFPPSWNLNGCPTPNAQGPFPPNYSSYNWWHGGFQNTYDNANNPCNFLNNRFNAFMSQIDQNMSSGPPSCSPKHSNMLYSKIQILRELSLRGNCNHSWT